MATTELDYYEVLGVERRATRRRDQARVPQARPAVAPRRQQGSRRPTSASRRSTRRTRCCPTRSAGRPTTCSARAGVESGGAGAGFEGFGGFGDIFDAFFGGGGRRQRPRDAAGRQPGSDLRYDLRITFAEAIKGTEKEIEFRSLERCETCAGIGRQAGHRADDLPAVRRPRRGAQRPPDDARPDGQRQRLPAVPRRGQDRRDAVRHLPWRRPRRAQAQAARHDPAGIDEGHQIRLSGEGEVGPRGGPAGSLYVAVHVAAASRRSSATGTELFYEATVSIAQAALGTTLTVPTVEGDEEVEIKAGHAARHRDPAARQGRAASAAQRLARRPPRHGRGRGADASFRRSSASCSRRIAKESGDAVAAVAGSSTSSVWGDRPDLERHSPGNEARRGRGRTRGVARACGRGRPRGRRGGQRDPGPRGATAGRRVEPAFELVDEGLGARVDPSRPAMVRGLRAGARSGARPRPRSRRRPSALGHLQAFELRPIGELRTRVVHEEDWAEAWKAHFPVLRVGRRLVIRPTWRRHRAEPGDVVIALDPGMAFGTGLHPTTRLCLAGHRAAGRRRACSAGRARPRRRLRLGDPGDRGGAARRAAASASTRTRSRSRRRSPTPAATGSAAGRGARWAALPTGDAPFDLVLANLIAGRPRPAGAATSRDELAPGGHARSRRASSSTARPRSATAFERGRAADHGADRRGGLGRPRGGRVPAADRASRRPTIAPDARTAGSRSCSRPTSRSRSACSCRRSCCRSRSARDARRSSRTAAWFAGLLWGRRTGRWSSALAWRSRVSGSSSRSVVGAPAAVAGRRPRDLRAQPRRSRSSSSARTCDGSSVSGRTRRPRSGRPAPAPAVRLVPHGRAGRADRLPDEHQAEPVVSGDRRRRDPTACSAGSSPTRSRRPGSSRTTSCHRDPGHRASGADPHPADPAPAHRVRSRPHRGRQPARSGASSPSPPTSRDRKASPTAAIDWCRMSVGGAARRSIISTST